MVIDCPDCGSQFRLDPKLLEPKGRKLRCSECQAVWFQDPVQDPVEDQPVEEEAPDWAEDMGMPAGDDDAQDGDAAGEQSGAETEHEPGRDRPPLDSAPPLDDFVEPEELETRKRKKPKPAAKGKAAKQTGKRGGAALAWVLLLLIIGGTGAGFWYGRKEIVTFYPKAMKLYDLAGIPVFPVGEGLDLVNMKTERGRGDNGESLIVISGQIQNITELDVIIPKLQASLLDREGVALTRKTLQMEPAHLEPGQFQNFTISLTSTEGASNVVTIFVSDEQSLKEPDFEPTS